MSTEAERPFIPGLELGEIFYTKAVRPVLDHFFPGLAHTAALIGSGSEILGFDDRQSTDHHWGPRLLLFLNPADKKAVGEKLHETLAHQLPTHIRGYSTHFSPPDPEDNGTQLLVDMEQGPVNHRVELHTISGFFTEYLAMDIDQPLAPADWLTLPEQHLRTVTAGAVYHDDLGLNAIRARFAYYPHEVRLYLLAAGWARIGQEEHLMSRAGQVAAGKAGGEIGSALIGARLVRDIMRLCFLMERVYAPYPKWFGTAFAQLDCAPALMPHLQAALNAATWPQRETHLVAAYEYLAGMHNALKLTEVLPEKARQFWGRPFRVMAIHGFSEALLAQISDPLVKRIAQRPPIGGIDQFSDNTDLIANPHHWRSKLRNLYT